MKKEVNDKKPINEQWKKNKRHMIKGAVLMVVGLLIILFSKYLESLI